jgi:hypothetical protein
MSIASKFITERYKGPKNIITYKNTDEATMHFLVK